MMSESVNKISASKQPVLSKGLGEAAVSKITKRLKLFLENDEHISGIFKPTGFILQAIVVTNYRIIGVKSTESHGNVVFTSEVLGKDMQSVLLQAKRNMFGKIAYDVIIEGHKPRPPFQP